MKSSTQLKPLISQGRFTSITHFSIQYLVNKIFPRRSPAPLSKLAFSVFLAVIFGLLYLLGLAGNYAIGRVRVTSQVMSIFLLGIAYIYLLCIVIEFQVEKFLKSIKENLLDALVMEQDRQSLHQSMLTIFSLRRQLWFGMIFSLAVHLAFIAVDPGLVNQFGLGFLFVNVVFHAFHGFCVYFYFAYLEWVLSDLKNYRYDLFELDPSSTAIIPKLGMLLQSTISLVTLMVASATIIFSSTRVLPFASVAAMVLMMWLSTIALFLVNRHILKSIIVRAKWEKLTKIQEQIRELEGKDKIPTQETLELINQLKEYHDKIKASPDSPWNLIKFFNTVNSLIWPTLGIIASNLGGFLEFIQQISKFLSP
jgi:hypothetical protein